MIKFDASRVSRVDFCNETITKLLRINSPE